MTMYKLIYDDLLDKYSILRKSDGCIFVSHSNGNMDWEQFLQDIKQQGIGIVEGPDIVTPDYKAERQNEYPPIAEQLDQLYWDLKNGRLDTGDWIQNITKIKLKHSKSNTGTTSIGELPQWVITEGTGNFP